MEYKLYLLDIQTGEILEKNFKEKPNLSQIKAFKRKIKRRKAYQNSEFDSYEIYEYISDDKYNSIKEGVF